MGEKKKGLEAAGEAYAKWGIARLRLLDQTLADGREFLVGGRFTIADICVHYALDLIDTLGIAKKFGPLQKQTVAYMERLRERPCYKAAVEQERASLAEWHDGKSKL